MKTRHIAFPHGPRNRKPLPTLHFLHSRWRRPPSQGNRVRLVVLVQRIVGQALDQLLEPDFGIGIILFAPTSSSSSPGLKTSTGYRATESASLRQVSSSVNNRASSRAVNKDPTSGVKKKRQSSNQEHPWPSALGNILACDQGQTVFIQILHRW